MGGGLTVDTWYTLVNIVVDGGGGVILVEDLDDGVVVWSGRCGAVGRPCGNILIFHQIYYSDLAEPKTILSIIIINYRF